MKMILIIESVSPSNAPGIGGPAMTVKIATIIGEPRIVKEASVAVTPYGADTIAELLKETVPKAKAKVMVEMDEDQAVKLGLRQHHG